LITIIFGRAAQFLLALLMMRVATTLLSPQEMGRVSLVLSTTAFFALFFINPVGMFINRRLHSWQGAGVARHYLTRYAGYLLMVALVASLALSWLSVIGVVNFGVPLGWLLLLVCGSLFFNTINQTAIPSLNLLGDSRRFVFLSIVTLAAGFLFAVLSVKLMWPSAQHWLFGLMVGQALLAALGTKILFAQLKRRENPRMSHVIQRRHLQALFAFAWPVAIAAGLGWVQAQGYRYLLQERLGLAPLGLFVAGYGISIGMIAGFESILTTYFQPRLYRDASLGDPTQQAQAWRRYATAVIPSLLLTVAMIVILAPELTRILLGVEYQSAAEYVIWGALAEAARVLMGVYSLIAHVYMRTRWLILPNLIGAGLSITLCALLIPSWGAVGAGVGLVSSGFASVAAIWFFLPNEINARVSLRPVLWAAIVAMGLGGLALALRYWMAPASWASVGVVICLVGCAYLGAQYLFLRRHIL
jgi:O-antigen/teichoic acid export membrane protein